ncbi:MAG: hypothetical protein IT438_10785 [Phycisphaerales bacterium]|nr:hypothetical protein [Phycisphaerales bacterium]
MLRHELGVGSVQHLEQTSQLLNARREIGDDDQAGIAEGSDRTRAPSPAARRAAGQLAYLLDQFFDGSVPDPEDDRLKSWRRVFERAGAWFGLCGTDPQSRHRCRFTDSDDTECAPTRLADRGEPARSQHTVRQLPQLFIAERPVQPKRNLALEHGGIILDVEIESLRRKIDQPGQFHLAGKLKLLYRRTGRSRLRAGDPIIAQHSGEGNHDDACMG